MTTYSKAQFDLAVKTVSEIPKDCSVTPTQDDQLYFYRYYKQATVGDVNTSQPYRIDFVNRAKWDSWKEAEGTSTEEAQSKYVAHLLQILSTATEEDIKEKAEAIKNA